MRRWKSGTKNRSSRQSRTRVGTSGWAGSGHGSSHSLLTWSRPRAWHSSASSAGTPLKNCSVSVRPFGDSKPVLPHHCPGGSPGAGIIPARYTSSRARTFPATSGAVNPPYEWPTTATSVRSPSAASTVSVNSASPAAGSVIGRSGAIASWPRARSSGPSRWKSHPLPPPPWISANVVMPASSAAAQHVRQGGLLALRDSQSVVVLHDDPVGRVGAPERDERRLPLVRRLVALLLVEVVGDGEQLRPGQVVGELLALLGRPRLGAAGPGLPERDHVVDVEVGRLGPGLVVVDALPRPGRRLAVLVGLHVGTGALQHDFAGVTT